MLHLFCKENGYGYLIMDGQGKSIYDIRSRVLDTVLTEKLNAVLQKQGMIVWRNIKEIKSVCPVSNVDIATYVLQNRLRFTMAPFCIKRREFEK